jgi:hypothetical protein
MKQFITADTETRKSILFWNTLIPSTITKTYSVVELPAKLRCRYPPYRIVGEVAAPPRRTCSESTKYINNSEICEIVTAVTKGTVFWSVMLRRPVEV